MNLRKLTLGVVSAAVLSTPLLVTAAQAQDKPFFPGLVYRTGPYAPSGIPVANGMRDYYAYLNKKGGLDGVQVEYEECETGYNTKRGVECYEKLKSKKPLVISPFSTGITYQLIPKAAVDKIPVHSMGYGRTDAADGRVFPWIFNFPTTYWSQASAFIKYIAAKEGGLDKLKGKKIVLIYHNSAYGKEPIPTLTALEKKYGYKLTTLAVDHPGQEQRSTWLNVRRLRPNWIILWGWGVMNQVAIKEATSIGFPMDHMIGVWWSGSEADVRPTGEAAKGYIAGTWHAPGTDTPLLKDMLKVLYNDDLAKAKENNWGEVLYNRGIVQAVYQTQAALTAMKHFKTKNINSEQMRWGLEHLDLTAEKIKELGLEGFMRPIKVSCADHETGGAVLIQQWDGKQWKIISDWIDPMTDVIRPMIEESAAKYAKENKIKVRDCK